MLKTLAIATILAVVLCSGKIRVALESVKTVTHHLISCWWWSPEACRVVSCALVLSTCVAISQLMQLVCMVVVVVVSSSYVVVGVQWY